jgi:zinc protease
VRESRPSHAGAGGADLLAWPRAGSGLVTIACHVPRAAPETEADAGLAALALRSAARGAGGLDARGIALAFERLGGSLLSSAGPDLVGYSTTVLAEHLDEAARLLALVLDEPAFDPPSVARERAVLLTESEQVRDDMGRWPLLLALRGAFGPRGYGLPVAGLPGSLAGLDAPRARGWHRTAFGGRRTVVLSGDAALDALFAAGRRLAAGAAAGGGEGADARDAWAALPGPAEHVEHRAKAQTAIAMVFPGPARADPRRRAAEVWAAIAGGLGGRMFEALRSSRSLAYSVVAGALQRRHGGRLTAYLATSPAREAEAREAMSAELARFRAEPPSAAEVARATGFLAGQAQVARQRTAALANELLDAWLRGTGLGELEDPAAGYRAVTAEEVWAVAQALATEAAAVGIVRGD